MDTFATPVPLPGQTAIGQQKLLLISGPCVIENEALCFEIARFLKEVCAELDVTYVFKASFDKANRTSVKSYRGPGLEAGLDVLQKIKDQLGVLVTTDFHTPEQAASVGAVVDILQVPAFLCRQTDLLAAAGETGKVVNVKKGQFMTPEDMQYAVNKVKETGNDSVVLTERGTTFGYQNLVVDMRSLPIMRQYAPVVFDVTHSVQRPGAGGGKSAGDRQFAPYLAKAAAAVGVDGFFIETHPNPAVALSDGPNMIPLQDMKKVLSELVAIARLRQSF
ncbi:MAG TPA: 3-deoxy-8-phosphooctulonate synthase [Saprospiraceae bacterium]|nr:3-deoxy-8-phosphooctulonate synthase [Saprospiraceae bacterium]HMQ83740.1 3-deoxy-8-phosphooctulonate synthase [Saprospiraceae bacterium]